MATFSSGMKLTAAMLENIIAPGWTTYTPSWTSSGTTPAIGNGTLAGRYRRSTGSDLVIAEVRVLWGTTTTNGTGVFFFSLPFTAHADADDLSGGSWFGNDLSAQDYSGAAKLESTTTFRLVRDTGSVAATVPFTWANGDNLRAQVIYQPA